MILNKTPLRVVANPYLTLDNTGFPTGAARLDPEVSAGGRLYIGAQLVGADVLATRNAAEISAGLAPTLQINRWAFSLDPIDIADTPYHRNILRQGVIFVADEKTHRTIFGASRKFQTPTEALAASRLAIIDEWKAEHEGEEPAFVTAEKEEAAALAAAEKAAKKAAAAAPSPPVAEAPPAPAPAQPTIPAPASSPARAPKNT